MAVPTLETVLYEKRDHIAWITLNRPDVLNAQNAQVGEDLTVALTDFNNDPDSSQGDGRRVPQTAARLTVVVGS